MKNSTKAMLVVFEGLDGTGKTSCAKELAAELNWRYMATPNDVLRKHRGEILASFGGNQEAAHLFYLASVFDAAAEIRRHMDDGVSILLDRYFLSTTAYAEFRGSCLELDNLGDMLPVADLTCFLDAPLEVRRNRLQLRDESPDDTETLNPESELRLKRLHISRKNKPYVGKWCEIDASGAMNFVLQKIRVELFGIQ